MLHIVKTKQTRADHAEQMAKLVSLRAPDKPSPTEQDWIDAAAAIGCHPAHLLAVRAVESGGAAFNSEGRLVIAYEPQVFSRNTTPKHAYLKSHPQLAYRRYVPYRSVPPSERSRHPMGMSQEGRWDLLLQACALDFHAGTTACSYGMWQIMGEGYRPMGFTSPMHMIEVMYEGHDGQWQCFLRFCKWKGALKPLIAGDWARFEVLYNGGGQKGAYARRLMAAASDARKTLA